jgi:hypothetical protein
MRQWRDVIMSVDPGMTAIGRPCSVALEALYLIRGRLQLGFYPFTKSGMSAERSLFRIPLSVRYTSERDEKWGYRKVGANH